MPVKYTPGQLRDAIGITKETFRYWRRELPGLVSGTGHSPCFGPGELLATAIAKRAVDHAGVSIGNLAPLAQELFSICDKMPWPQLDGLSAVLVPRLGKVSFIKSGKLPLSNETVVIVPMGPIVRELQDKFSAGVIAQAPKECKQ